MGATVLAYWPTMTPEQMYKQPAFPSNDCAAWANWMLEMQKQENQTPLKAAGVDALLSFTTEGIKDEEVNWVTPDTLATAALKLCDLLAQAHPAAQCALRAYELDANGVQAVEEEFLTDLQELAALARWAKTQGATRMTLAVNW